MKVHFTKWRTYNTPYFSVIPNDDYIQISFIVWNLHWWIIVNRRKGGKL